MKLAQKDFEIPDDLPVSELEELRGELDSRIAQRREREKEVAAQRIMEVANDLGFRIPELMHLLQEPKNLPVRYRHPENPDLTWCGKGRRPLWMTDALREGVTLEEMAA